MCLATGAHINMQMTQLERRNSLELPLFPNGDNSKQQYYLRFEFFLLDCDSAKADKQSLSSSCSLLHSAGAH